MPQVIDRQPDNPRPVCERCAVWICTECWEYRRRGAVLTEPPICRRCGGIQGQFIALRHRSGKSCTP